MGACVNTPCPRHLAREPIQGQNTLLYNYPSQLCRSHCILLPEHKQRYFKPC